MSRQATITQTVDRLLAQGVPLGEAIAQAVSGAAATPAPARWVTLPDGRITKVSHA